LELNDDCAIAAPFNIDGLLIEVDVASFCYERQLNQLELIAFERL
jgi:hypothetical protein